MTSLSSQLKTLRASSTALSGHHGSKRPSLLFDAKEAADIPNDAIFSLGSAGFENLALLNNELTSFKDTLFNESFLQSKRSSQTVALNAKIQKLVKKYLYLVCPYFAISSTAKTLEWLIRKFEIHRYEPEIVLRAFLPYHETRLFARLLQILDFSATGDRWAWLQKTTENGVPLSKLTLTKRCANDAGFLKFICNIPSDVEEVLSESIDPITYSDQATTPINRTLSLSISFSASILITVLQSTLVVKEELMGAFMPFVLEWLLSKSSKTQAYVVLCLLAQKISFSQKVKESLIKSVCKSIDQMTAHYGLLCLATLVKFQDISSVDLRTLLKVSNLKDHIVKAASENNISSFLMVFLSQLTRRLLTETETEFEIDTDFWEEALIKMFKDMELPFHVSYEVARTIVETFVSAQKNDLCLIASFSDKVKLYAEALEKRHPSVMEVAVKSSREKFCKTTEKKLVSKWMKQFNQTVFLPTSEQANVREFQKEDSSSLFLSLNHANADIRLAAVQFLIEGVMSGRYDKAYATEQLLLRLQDTNESFLPAIVKYGEKLVSLMDPVSLFDALLHLLYEDRIKNRETFCHIFFGYVKHNIHLRDLSSDAIVVLELLNHCLILTSDGKVSPLKNLYQYISQHDTKNLTMPLQCLKAAFGSIDWQKMTDGLDERRKAINKFLDDWVEQLLRNAHFAQMITSMWDHAHKGSSNNAPSFLVNFMISKCLQLGKDQPDSVIPLISVALTHVQSLHFESCKRKHLQLFKNGLSINDIEDELLKIYLSDSKTRRKKELCVRGLILLLQNIVVYIPKYFRDTQDDDAVYKCHIELFRSLCLLGSKTESDKDHILQACRPMLQLYLRVHFRDAADVLTFLGRILADPSSLTWMYNVSPPLATTESCLFALHVAASALSTLQGALTEGSNILWTLARILLVYLAHTELELREAAINCLRVLESVVNNHEPTDKKIKLLISSVLAAKEDVKLAAHSFLEKLFRPLNEESKKYECRKQLLATLLRDQPSHLQFCLLSVLKDVACKDLSLEIMSIAASLVRVCKTRELSTEEINILYLTLQRSDVMFEVSSADIDYLHILMEFVVMRQICNLTDSSIQLATLDQINDKLFASLKTVDRQVKLLSTLINIIVDNKHVNASCKAKQIVNKLKLDSHHFLSLLEKAFSSLDAEEPQSVKRPRRSKSVKDFDKAKDDEQKWQQLLIILEEIHHRPYEEGSEMFMQYYFKILKRCHDSKGYILSPDYTKQLVMGCLLKVTSAVATQSAKAMKLKSKDFNVELIIGCIRNSEDHHTHRQALLLLGKAALLFPDLVLHNMMSIFAFVGTCFSRQDDSYSFQIIKDTISSVVPALIGIKTPHLSEAGQAKQVAEIKKHVIGVFADAAPYIPGHRRLTLFTHLANVIGPEKDLHLIITNLLTRAITKGVKKNDSDMSKEEVLSEEFCVSLVVDFPVHVVMNTVTELTNLVLTLMRKEREADNATKSASQLGKENIVAFFDPSYHTPKELRYFIYLAMNVVSAVLSNLEFQQKVQNLEDMEQENMEKKYLDLLQVLLSLVKEESASEQGEITDNVVKFRKAIVHKGCNIIDKIDHGLKFTTFIKVFKNLIAHETSAVQRKAIELVCEKLVKTRELSESATKELLSIVNILVNIISAKGIDESEAIASKQSALLALRLFCKHLGAQNAPQFLAAAPSVIKCNADAVFNEGLRGSTVLCLAEFCAVFTVQMIRHLKSFIPSLVNLLDVTTERNSTTMHAALIATSRMIEAIPQFLSPYLPKIVDCICHPLTGNKSKNVIERFKDIRLTIAGNVLPRILLPAVTSCLSGLAEKPQGYLQNLMEIIVESLSKMPNTNVQLNISAFHEIFVKAFEYRVIKTDAEIGDVLDDERSVVNAYCLHVMKLSENSFRPLFWKIFAWATDDKEKKDRLITFFHLCCGIADKLKSLFLMFAKQVIQTARSVLEENHPLKSDSYYFHGESSATEKTSLLIEFTLECLTKCFTYDRMGFIGNEEFEFLLDPLVDQIENNLGSEDAWVRRIQKYLVPCIYSFTTVVHDESCWKNLNYRILLKTKSKDAKLRLGALDIFAAMQSALKQSYAMFLAEAIPFLAELMEDESEDVERKCHDVISQIEANSGESVQKYF